MKKLKSALAAVRFINKNGILVVYINGLRYPAREAKDYFKQYPLRFPITCTIEKEIILNVTAPVNNQG